MSTGPSFRFRLERVRALRERRTESARLELAKAISTSSDSRMRLYDVNAELERAREQQRRAALPASAVDAHQLHAQQAYAERVEAQRRARLEEHARHEAAVAGRTEELTRAARSQRTLERLKERKHAEHEREASRLEGALLDEIAIERHRRSAA
ncbi:MAG TPA: flagellar export protein FliJ [Solirubrobacteraceae bacterium]|nr:flagellar export protein FliJ [Solirubrobacteraceae bacterium]